MKETIVLIFTLIFCLILVIEIGMRSLFGFGNPLIYIADEKIGYLLAPNQRTRRYGNRIEINQYSMRSEDIEPTPSFSTLRVLLLGDSITNGGWWTDQDNTISSLIQRSLISKNISKYPQVQVLNASANSWGPRNELAYLEKFGGFQAQVVVLLINTDDLFATAPTSLPVGRDRNYPDRKPPFALVEVFRNYILKPKSIAELKTIYKEDGDRVARNLEAIGKIQALTRQNNSQFLLVMTPLLREIGSPGSRDYELQARQRLSEFTKTQKIAYIDFLPEFNTIKNPKALYHDHIHLNLQGNQLVSEVIKQKLVEILRIMN
ncbi:MAG: SGNH/GDSL hydrolase family protein [Fischerella sp. CENA71]|nr:SGNH/GDSL hydrolase family protein [Fischerella sp. CENA71]